LFGSKAPLLIALWLLSGGIVLYLSWFRLLLRRQSQRYAPLPGSLRRLPLIGPVASSYNEYVWLSYAALLGAVGMEPVEVLQAAATRVSTIQVRGWVDIGAGIAGAALIGVSALEQDLTVAARLGKMGEEIQFQREATVEAFLGALAHCR